MNYRENSYSQSPEQIEHGPQDRPDLPLPSVAEQHKLREVGVEAISNVDKNQEIVSPNNAEVAPAFDIVELDPSTKQNTPDTSISKDTSDFSHNKEYDKVDDNIIRKEISLLEKNPYNGTEMVHRDKEKYLSQKFGRIFGEKAA